MQNEEIEGAGQSGWLKSKKTHNSIYANHDLNNLIFDKRQRKQVQRLEPLLNKKVHTNQSKINKEVPNAKNYQKQKKNSQKKVKLPAKQSETAENQKLD